MKKILLTLLFSCLVAHTEELPLPGTTWLPSVPGKQGPFFEKIRPMISSEPNKVLEMIAQEEKKKHDQPFSPAFDYIRGIILFRENKLSEANEAFDKALIKLPTYVDAIRAKSVIALRSNNKKNAIQNLQQLLNFGAAGANDLRSLAWLYEEKKQFRAAGEIYRQLLIRDPEMPQLKKALAANYIRQKRFPEARVLLQEELDKNPNNKELWQQTIAVTQNIDLDETLLLLEKARLIGTLSPQQRLFLAQLMHRKNMLSDAATLYLQAARDTQLSAEDRLNSLESLMATTLKATDKDLDIDMKDLSPQQKARCLTLRARLALKSKQFAQAEELINQALDNDSLCAEATFEMGQLRQQQQRIEEALTAFETAADDTKMRLRALLAKASLLSRERQFRDAVETMERILRLDDQPAYRNFHRQLQNQISK